jgi:hypothetical protein
MAKNSPGPLKSSLPKVRTTFVKNELFLWPIFLGPASSGIAVRCVVDHDPSGVVLEGSAQEAIAGGIDGLVKGITLRDSAHLQIRTESTTNSTIPNFTSSTGSPCPRISDRFPVHCRAVARTGCWLDSEASNPELQTLDLIRTHDRVAPVCRGQLSMSGVTDFPRVALIGAVPSWVGAHGDLISPAKAVNLQTAEDKKIRTRHF